MSLRTIEYIEGNPQQGRLTPRLVGFMNEAEVEFFELICSVDGVGVRKALRAIVRPVREVAAAIEEQNIEELVALPGVGPAVAERIIAKLRRKMARFALMVARDTPAGRGNGPRRGARNVRGPAAPGPHGGRRPQAHRFGDVSPRRNSNRPTRCWSRSTSTGNDGATTSASSRNHSCCAVPPPSGADVRTVYFAPSGPSSERISST